MRKLILLLSLMLILYTSCSLKSERDGSVVTKESYPDIVMEKTRAQIGQDNGSPISLEADKMTLYSEDGFARLENFSFTSYSREGEIETEGRAARGEVKLDGSEIELSGAVTFSRPLDNMLIMTDNLIYNKDNDEITAEGRVIVNSEEGTIEGENFMGDLKNKIYTFSSIEKGDFDLE